MQPKIIERMNLPPIQEKPLINIITEKVFAGKSGAVVRHHLDEQQLGITIFSDSSKRSQAVDRSPILSP
jgi:hypothetical protein